MADFGLVEPFDVDDGQLDGIRPNEIFTMGVEFEMLRQRLLPGEENFRIYVNRKNSERLIALCERHDRFVECGPVEYEDWQLLIVGGRREGC